MIDLSHPLPTLALGAVWQKIFKPTGRVGSVGLVSLLMPESRRVDLVFMVPYPPDGCSLALLAGLALPASDSTDW